MPLEIHLQGFEINHFSSRLLSMAKPVYNAVVGHGGAEGKPAIVVVPSRKQAQLTAIDLITYAAAGGEPLRFFHGGEEGDGEELVAGVKEPALRDTLVRVFLFVGVGG